ncbi:MAG: alpha/beta fold hydrolase, partial [Acidimicrobiales bacterium]
IPAHRPAETDAGPLLHVVERGSGPRLVLVHGVAGSHMVWDEISPHLESRFTLTSLDLLGYGHSPKPDIDYTPAAHVEAIRRTLADAGFDPPHTFVGLSMGVNLVLEFARRWPDEVAEMVGIGFPYYPSESEARRALQHNAWIRLTLRHPRIAAVVTPITWKIGRRTAWLFQSRSTLYPPRVAADALRARYCAFRSSLYNCMVHFRQDEALESSAQMPRLFIHGADDRWAGAQAMRAPLAKYQNSSLEVIEGPHNLVVADPARTAGVIAGYLERVADPNGV